MISPIKIWEASKSILNGVKSLKILIPRVPIGLLVVMVTIGAEIKTMFGAITATEEATLLAIAKIGDDLVAVMIVVVGGMIDTEADPEIDAMTNEEGLLGDQGLETQDLTIGITKPETSEEVIAMTETTMTDEIEETESLNLTAEESAEEITTTEMVGLPQALKVRTDKDLTIESPTIDNVTTIENQCQDPKALKSLEAPKEDLKPLCLKKNL